MIAVCFAVLCVFAGGVAAGYAGSSENDLGYGGSGDSYGYGYSGSFSGGGPPNFAIPAFDFSGFLGGYADSLSRFHNEFVRKGGGAFSYSHASSSPSASARAQSSLTFETNNRLQSNAHGGYGDSGGFSGGYGGSFGSGSNGAYGGSFSGPGAYSYSTPNTGPRVYPERVNFDQRSSFGTPNSGAASSSASIGPGGVHQTAAVFPENPKSPNINTRFAAAPSVPGGFRSVFTTSESRTSNVNGKPVTIQKAATTVNDNGKILTYVAKTP